MSGVLPKWLACARSPCAAAREPSEPLGAASRAALTVCPPSARVPISRVLQLGVPATALCSFNAPDTGSSTTLNGDPGTVDNVPELLEKPNVPFRPARDRKSTRLNSSHLG